jgi:hypothetical protein
LLSLRLQAQMFLDAKKCEESAGITAARNIFIWRPPILTGASLDKAGSVYPMRRVGIMEWGWG